MTLRCTNDNCKKEKEIHRVKVKFDNNGNKKSDDTLCECGSKMVDPEAEDKDFSDAHFRTPKSHKSFRYFERRKKSNDPEKNARK